METRGTVRRLLYVSFIGLIHAEAKVLREGLDGKEELEGSLRVKFDSV